MLIAALLCNEQINGVKYRNFGELVVATIHEKYRSNFESH